MVNVLVRIGEINVCDLLVMAGLVASKGEARRLIEQNGISLDDKKVAYINQMVNAKGEIVAKKGKKVYLKIKFN